MAKTEIVVPEDNGEVLLRSYNGGTFSAEEISVEQITVTRRTYSVNNTNHGTREQWLTNPPARLKDKYVKSFIKKLNESSLRIIEQNSTNINHSQEREEKLYPQMKTGFNIYKGEYVPQKGFSARFLPKSGRLVSLQEYVGEVQQAKPKPNFIIGPMGSGKTTLLKGLGKEIIRAHELEMTSMERLWESCFGCCCSVRGDFDIVHLVNIRDLPDLSEATLAQVLFNPSVTHLTVDEAQHGLQAILEGEVKIVILIDGLDQAAWEPKNDDVIGHWDKASTATIFGNILTGHLLPNVPITISSREHTIACLPETMRPSSITALVGFSEEDAGEIYTDMTGAGAREEWNELKSLNPRLMYMCLTPLFLKFYAIVKQSCPNVTVDCASAVLVRIIGLLLQSRNMKQTADVINKLKPMAFQGTQEQRVVFKKEDLVKFGLQNDIIDDIVIKVAGQNDLGQKILEGMHRYFFIHQSLQEILSAIHAAEKPLEDFKTFVDVELTKDFWSVVRSFLCGILKNRKVREGIPHDIFRAENLEEKCDYLMIKIALQLQSNPSPIQRLDLLVALNEADAAETIKSCTSTLDFSNTPMSADSLSLLITILRRLDHLPLLSLAGCGIDDQLLGLLAARPSNSQSTVKIDTLDMSGNTSWTSTQLWRTLFDRMSIGRCQLDIPPDQGAGVAYQCLLKIASAGRDGGVAVECRMSELYLNFEQIQELSRHGIRLHIGQLTIVTDITRGNFLPLRLFVSRHSVKRCQLTIQQDAKGVDPDFAVQVTESILTANTSQLQIEKLKVHQTNAEQLERLTRYNNRLKIYEVTIQPSNGQFDGGFWGRMFGQITIKKCLILPVKKVCADVWLKFVHAAENGNVEEIMLLPETNRGLTLKEIDELNRQVPSELTVTVAELKMRINKGDILSGEDWKMLGKAFKRFRMKKMYCESYPEFPKLNRFADGSQNIQFRQLRLAWKSDTDDMEYLSISRKEGDEVKIMYINSGQQRLDEQSYDIGEAINTLRIKDIVFGTIDGTLPTKSLLNGLGNAKIETLASMDLDSQALQAIYIQCEVRRLRILTNDKTKMKAIIASRQRLRNTGGHVINTPPTPGGDEAEWEDRFLTEDQWSQMFGLRGE